MANGVDVLVTKQAAAGGAVACSQLGMHQG